MNANEEDDAATARAGGDVIWKSASHASPAEPRDEKSNTASPENSESGTRAGGDVIIKGASQKKTENSE